MRTARADRRMLSPPAGEAELCGTLRAFPVNMGAALPDSSPLQREKNAHRLPQLLKFLILRTAARVIPGKETEQHHAKTDPRKDRKQKHIKKAAEQKQHAPQYHQGMIEGIHPVPSRHKSRQTVFPVVHVLLPPDFLRQYVFGTASPHAVFILPFLMR